MAGDSVYTEVPLEAFDAARLALEQPRAFDAARRVMEQAMNMPPAAAQYLTKEQAAEFAQVSVRTIERAIHDRELHAGGSRGLVRIRREAIVEWLERKERPVSERTVWRLLALPDHAFRPDVELVVDTRAPAVVEAIEEAARDNGLTLERVEQDPRFAEPVGMNEVAGLAVAFKALVLRSGGRVVITEAELLAARATLVRVDATPETMTVEVVDGEPPETPRFGAEQ